VGEDGGTIAAKVSREDVLVVPELVGRPLACFEGVYPDDSVDEFVLGCKRCLDDFAGTTVAENMSSSGGPHMMLPK
jgi:hypothetical protein